jgi:hypothetical protein
MPHVLNLSELVELGIFVQQARAESLADLPENQHENGNKLPYLSIDVRDLQQIG